MNKKSFTFALLLIAVVLTGIGVSGTYARYIAEDKGQGVASVARWNVTLSATNQAGESEDWDKNTTTVQTIKLTPVSNEFVATGKIAPDSKVEGTLTVDLTGTEVTADIFVSIDKVYKGNTQLTGEELAHFTTYLKDGLTTIADGDYIQVAYNDSSKVKNVTVGVEWPNDDNNNAWDTATGEAAPDIKVDLLVTVKQHIAADD